MQITTAHVAKGLKVLGFDDLSKRPDYLQKVLDSPETYCYTYKVAGLVAQLQAAVEALQSAQAFIADGGMAETGAGQSVYNQISSTLQATGAAWNCRSPTILAELELQETQRGPSNGVNCSNCGCRLPNDYNKACPDCGCEPLTQALLDEINKNEPEKQEEWADPDDAPELDANWFKKAVKSQGV